MKLSASEARAAAAYIYGAFYRPRGKSTAKPIRPDLAHLTVRQLRNTLTDLVGSFRPSAQSDSARSGSGLRGEYFNTAGLEGRVQERVDPEIRFAFGAKGAIPEQTDPYLFSMRWTGSVIAPDTGEYDFVVRTEHAARLWVNDMERPLIDRWVKSGSDTEFTGTVFLLGGRAYPIRLEFSKGIQGVNDPTTLKRKPPAPASIELAWHPPHRPIETIPSRDLTTVVGPELYVCTTPFPPDDRSMGFERGTFVSKEWEDATAQAAIETAGYVADHLRELSGAAPDAPDRKQRLHEFCRRFAKRAFRRPLAKDVEEMYVDRQFARAPNVESAVKRVVLLTLESPRFLYPDLPADEKAPPDGYVAASRLALSLWDSLPDAELLKAAAAGRLTKPEEVRQQADRMVADPRAWWKLRAFLLEWLKVDGYPDLARDPKLFPGFDAAAASDLRDSFELFLKRVAWGGRSDYRDLMLSSGLFVDGRLSKLYACGLPEDAPLQWVSRDPEERSGVLTQPYMLAALAHYDSTSPIHRGVLIVRSLLGRVLKPPPAAFAPLPASLHPDMTTRQRVELQTKPAMCRPCHSVINPLGFTLERFDAIGRVRNQDGGHAVDDTGSCRAPDGRLVRFRGARDLASYLASSPEAHRAFVQKLFQYATKQSPQAYGKDALPELLSAFTRDQFSIRKQLAESAAFAALSGRRAGAGSMGGGA